MSVFFVPYNGRKVAAVDIKGQRVLIVSQDKDVLTDGLHLLGANRVKTIEEHNPVEREVMFMDLAHKAKGNLVIIPEEASMDEVLNSLESRLNWIQ